jgi:hypothetical protein
MTMKTETKTIHGARRPKAQVSDWRLSKWYAQEEALSELREIHTPFKFENVSFPSS